MVSSSPYNNTPRATVARSIAEHSEPSEHTEPSEDSEHSARSKAPTGPLDVTFLSRFVGALPLLLPTVLPMVLGTIQIPLASAETPPSAVAERLPSAAPTPSEPSTPEALWLKAQALESTGAFRDALPLYDTLEMTLGTEPVASPYVALARDRAAYLRGHGEGNFGPLATLERLKSNPALGNDARHMVDLATASSTFPDGPVRSEARLFVAEAYLGRFHDDSEALPLLQAVLRDPHAPVPVATRALERLVDLRLRQGDVPGAEAALAQRSGPLAGSLPGPLAERLALAKQRLVLRRGTGAMLLLLLAATAWRLRQRPRRRSAWKYVPAAAAYALAVSIGGGGLSFSYSNGSVPPVLPFVQLGVGSGLLLLVARVWALPAGAPWGPRLLRALVLAGCAFVLSAFLLLGLNGPSLFRLGS